VNEERRAGRREKVFARTHGSSGQVEGLRGYRGRHESLPYPGNTAGLADLTDPGGLRRSANPADSVWGGEGVLKSDRWSIEIDASPPRLEDRQVLVGVKRETPGKTHETLGGRILRTFHKSGGPSSSVLIILKGQPCQEGRKKDLVAGALGQVRGFWGKTWGILVR
jgi:hypothetical protein